MFLLERNDFDDEGPGFKLPLLTCQAYRCEVGMKRQF